MTGAPFWAAMWIVARELMLFAAIGFLILGIDELIVDLIWIVTRVKSFMRGGPRWSTADLPPPRADRHFAIFVPAWDEAGVIGDMLSATLSHLPAHGVRLFVALYPNDEGTARVVKEINDERLFPVTLPHDGPTTKADALNTLWRAMRAEERQSGERITGIVLHDAEDVTHPAEIPLFAHMAPRKAMVQLPVVPLRDAASRWVSGHYIDEFAEQHGKTLVVREALGLPLPSAGVATFFRRAELGRIADARGGGPFAEHALTEDYDLGLAMSRLGGGALVRLPEVKGQRVVATREHFPATLEAALRQKTRWLTGIVFQGWQGLGWRTTAGAPAWRRLAELWFLARDRSPLLNALFISAGYLAALVAGVCAIAAMTIRDAAALPPLVEAGSPLSLLLWITVGLLVWRLAVRAWFTGRLYGILEAVLSVPRSIVANVIAVLAARRAFMRYAAAMLGGAPLAWDKTAHKYPAPERER